jgi:hypothetical protein
VGAEQAAADWVEADWVEEAVDWVGVAAADWVAAATD